MKTAKKRGFFIFCQHHVVHIFCITLRHSASQCTEINFHIQTVLKNLCYGRAVKRGCSGVFFVPSRCRSRALQYDSGGYMDYALRQIENHGLTLVLLLMLILWLKPKADEMWTTFVRMANPAPKEPLAERLRRSNELNEKIMRSLQGLVGEYRAQRAYVFQFHNGCAGVTGVPFAKTSCTHEVVTLGVRPQQKWLQDMPVTLVWSFVRLFETGLGVVCPDIAACFAETDASTYETLRVQGVKSVYCCALRSDTRDILGFVGLDYCNEYRELSSEELTKLQIHAERIAAMFCSAGHEMCSMRGVLK